MSDSKSDPLGTEAEPYRAALVPNHAVALEIATKMYADGWELLTTYPTPAQSVPGAAMMWFKRRPK